MFCLNILLKKIVYLKITGWGRGRYKCERTCEYPGKSHRRGEVIKHSQPRPKKVYREKLADPYYNTLWHKTRGKGDNRRCESQMETKHGWFTTHTVAVNMAMTKERLISSGFYDLAKAYQSVHVNY